MKNLLFVLLLCVVPVQAAEVAKKAESPKSKEMTYAEAYKVITVSKRPLFVILGAPWCHYCEKLKKEVIPKVKFGKKVLVMVDADKDQALAKQLSNEQPIPQIIRYRYDPKVKGWLRTRLMGYRSIQEVQEFVDETETK